MPEPLAVAVVGAGSFGARHARAVAESSRARLAVVVDLNEDIGRTLAEGHGADWVPTVQEALSRGDLDAYTVAVPDHLHVDAAVPLLEAGASVLLEKPIGHSLEAARQIAAAAERGGARLTVGHLFRFDPRYTAMRRAVEAGQLGELLHADAMRLSYRRVGERVRNSSPSLFLGIHEIDALQWFTGRAVVEVSAAAVRKHLQGKGIDNADAIVAIVKFDNGAVGRLCFGWTLPDNVPTGLKIDLQLVGDRGVLHLNTDHTGVDVLGPDGYSVPEPVYSVEVNGALAGSIQTEIDSYLRALQDGTEFAVPLADVMSAVAVNDAITRSVASGDWESVERD